jgi:hypothetical protein
VYALALASTDESHARRYRSNQTCHDLEISMSDSEPNAVSDDTPLIELAAKITCMKMMRVAHGLLKGGDLGGAARKLREAAAILPEAAR